MDAITYSDVKDDGGPFNSPSAHAAAKEYAAKHSRAEAPPPEPAQSWLDTIKGIFSKKKADFGTVYRALLRKSELEGETLSAAEIKTMAEAMQATGVTVGRAGEHREAIRKLRRFEEAEKAVAATRGKLDAAKGRHRRAETALTTAQMELNVAAAELQDLNMRIGFLASDASQAEGQRETVAAIFAD